jgi:hypothetical protein
MNSLTRIQLRRTRLAGFVSFDITIPGLSNNLINLSNLTVCICLYKEKKKMHIREYNTPYFVTPGIEPVSHA